MPTQQVRRPRTADPPSDLDRLARLVAEHNAPAPVSCKRSEGSPPPHAGPRIASARLIDLERRARFGRFGFGAA
ncbi:MAG: hypothetical protein WB816_07885 [Methylocystis sp.]